MAIAEKKKDEPSSGERASSLMGIVLGVIAVAAFVGLLLLARKRDDGPDVRELPHAVVMLEFEKLDRPTRERIAQLEDAILALGDFQVLGPGQIRILVPQGKPMDPPSARRFVELDDVEWEKAWRYAPFGEWLVPRLFRLDGTACIIRIGNKPPRGFPADAKAKLEGVIEPFRAHFKNVRAYSKAAQLGTPADRDAINVTFGVQTAFAIANRMTQNYDRKLTWVDPAAMSALDIVKPIVIRNTTVRSVTTTANWVKHYWAVRSHAEREIDLPTKPEELTEAVQFAQSNGINILLPRSDGTDAILDVTASGEGRDNADLFWYLEANLQDPLKAEIKTLRPYVKSRLKD